MESSLLGKAGKAAEKGEGGELKPPPEDPISPGSRAGAGAGAEGGGMKLSKFCSVRGLWVYFCRDSPYHSVQDPEYALRCLREKMGASPPEPVEARAGGGAGAGEGGYRVEVPPLLSPCDIGVSLKADLSKVILGIVDTLDVRVLVGGVLVQAADEHIGFFLRWADLVTNHNRRLTAAAARPMPTTVLGAAAGEAR
ncbi:unnamed protein product, partial [Discosporangium mesarthrocarpum]